jgi:hypothetical protein
VVPGRVAQLGSFGCENSVSRTGAALPPNGTIGLGIGGVKAPLLLAYADEGPAEQYSRLLLANAHEGPAEPDSDSAAVAAPRLRASNERRAGVRTTSADLETTTPRAPVARKDAPTLLRSGREPVPYDSGMRADFFFGPIRPRE